MISVGIKELKAKLSAYVDKVRRGERFVITEHGSEVAMVIPISREWIAVKSLAVKNKAKWSGKKPEGIKGISIKGKPLSETILEERR
ncbi:MAG: type II toxin-antitoxin system prevent-host-death family antitoxin [Deltaproteobacteria bacterium]|nr:type II toxin-antitoxin system prevent-host-death family antitoxin [Deltaproteobacteria bacterium]